jgi:hypothetical protein
MPAGQEHAERPGQSWYKYGKAHPGRLVRCGIVAGVTTTELRWDEPGSTARRAASKVPQTTAIFWIIKVLTTGMGEAALAPPSRTGWRGRTAAAVSRSAMGRSAWPRRS